MSMRLDSSAVELGEETLIWYKYSVGTVTETFLSSKTESRMNDICKPYVCIAEGEKLC